MEMIFSLHAFPTIAVISTDIWVQISLGIHLTERESAPQRFEDWHAGTSCTHSVALSTVQCARARMRAHAVLIMRLPGPHPALRPGKAPVSANNRLKLQCRNVPPAASVTHLLPSLPRISPFAHFGCKDHCPISLRCATHCRHATKVGHGRAQT
jgi:hypothetical protein